MSVGCEASWSCKPRHLRVTGVVKVSYSTPFQWQFERQPTHVSALFNPPPIKDEHRSLRAHLLSTAHALICYCSHYLLHCVIRNIRRKPFPHGIFDFPKDLFLFFCDM